jgi:hypothetical protein
LILWEAVPGVNGSADLVLSLSWRYNLQKQPARSS